MLIFIMAEVGYRGGQVFYNALLPEVADLDETGRVSGIGWAIGLVGGIACLLIVLALVTMNEGTWIVRLSLVITAVFFATFAAPLFLWLRESKRAEGDEAGGRVIARAVEHLRRTLATVRRHREFVRFMIAFLIYNDGILMTVNFAAIFGAVVFGLDQRELILFMILVQVTSVVGALISGWLADRVSGKVSLAIFLGMMLAAVLGLFVNNSVAGFFVIGGVAGCALSAVQSTSRGMVAILSPPGRSAEFYGFFAVAGRTSSFIGPAIYGWVAAEAALWFEAQGGRAAFLWFEANPAGSNLAEQLGQRAAILPVIAFLVGGLALMLLVNEEGARRQRANTDLESRPDTAHAVTGT